MTHAIFACVVTFAVLIFTVAVGTAESDGPRAKFWMYAAQLSLLTLLLLVLGVAIAGAYKLLYGG